MYISGTLHLYSGSNREMFFVFDDVVAQELYASGEFDPDDKETRRVFISIGDDRMIARKTLNFSRKQTEIKVSLCTAARSDDSESLTKLYDWFAPAQVVRPEAFPVLGQLRNVNHYGEQVRELWIAEPVGDIVPPGLARRQREASETRKSFEQRRRIIERDLTSIGTVAECLALQVAQEDFPTSTYDCLWRNEFLDSEKVEIREKGIIADIDVWNHREQQPVGFIEVKAQKVSGRNDSAPQFFLSVAELRSYHQAIEAELFYRVWLFQYRDISDFQTVGRKLRLLVFESIDEEWIKPANLIVSPVGEQYSLYSVEVP